jgi:multidrug efflux pump subunit AcrA (membrane-fusion protein)
VTATIDRDAGGMAGDDMGNDWERPRHGRLVWLRRNVLRPIVLIPLIVVIAAAVWWAVHSSSSSSAQTGPVQRVVAVTAGPMSQTVSTSGTLAPADSENLSFSTSGQVTAVNVKAGQQVPKGTVLATLDSAALQSQVTSAQASVDSATAKLSNDQTTASSSAQIASDQANLAAAQAQLASAQASLSGATLTAPIDGTVAAVNLTVGQQLSGTGTGGTNLSGSSTGSGRTNTPSSSSGAGGNGFSGGNSNSSSSSSSSSSSTPQVQMISTGTYVVNVSVDDTQIGRIAVGQATTVTPSSSPAAGGRGGGAARFFGGGGAGGGQTTPTTTADNSQAQAAQGALGGQSQTPSATGTVTSVGAIATTSSGVSSFPVVVTLSGTPQGFFAGSTVNVAITYNQLTNVLQVPTLAITRSNGQSSVTISANGKKSQRPVTTGITSGGFTQITDGLTRGELVVVTIPTAATNANRAQTNGGGGGFGGGGGGFRGGGGGGGGLVRPGD